MLDRTKTINAAECRASLREQSVKAADSVVARLQALRSCLEDMAQKSARVNAVLSGPCPTDGSCKDEPDNGLASILSECEHYAQSVHRELDEALAKLGA